MPMYNLVYAFSKWLEGTPWAAVARGDGNWVWAYPFVQLIHFTGLSVWLGTNFTLDLRLLGVGRRRETAAQVAGDLFVWNWIGFCIVVLGGFLLFSATATTFLVNIAFDWKLGLFVPVALVSHIIIQRKARVWGQNMETPTLAKFAGLIEILLWICVVIAAVEIPNH
jgi:hypothetical protein